MESKEKEQSDIKTTLIHFSEAMAERAFRQWKQSLYKEFPVEDRSILRDRYNNLDTNF